MKLPIATRFTKFEWGFLFTAFAVLAIGTAISIRTRQPDWMPGVGAVVIVLGVVFAVFDLRSLLQLKADRWAKVIKAFNVSWAIRDTEKKARAVLSEEQRAQIRREVERRVEEQLPSQGPTIRKRFHFVEVFIVCLGTLVNGFGQKVVEWLLTSL